MSEQPRLDSFGDNDGESERSLDDYVDIEEEERQKFMELDGVGPKTAQRLVNHYDLFDDAVDSLLSNPNAWNRKIGRETCDDLRDQLQDLGYEPPCGCSHYEEVQNTQTRENFFSYCETCEEVISP